MSLKTIRNIILVSALIILTFGIGYRAGAAGFASQYLPASSVITNKTPPTATNVNFSLFWDVWDRLNRTYIDKKALDAQKMVYGAISGMVQSLNDPYTVFLTPDQNKEAKDDLGGKFEGIGAQLGIKDKKIIVIAPLKGTPAEQAGLKAGDWIIKVDNIETAGWTIPEAVAKIRGVKGSKVALTIMHPDDTKNIDVVLTRDEIKVASVELETLNVRCTGKESCQTIKDQCADCEKVYYLKLNRFGDNTAQEWEQSVTQIENSIKQSGKKGNLVFDLRNNPGGYLSGSVFIASEFLAQGPVVLQESTNEKRQSYDVNRQGQLLDIPMVVLINKGSASAAEIVAGALQEAGRAKLVGETSFGKGTIQEQQELSSGAGIHITTAKWLLPSGKWIHGTGIEPDVKITNDDKKPDVDLQLNKAIETLLLK